MFGRVQLLLILLLFTQKSEAVSLKFSDLPFGYYVLVNQKSQGFNSDQSIVLELGHFLYIGKRLLLSNDGTSTVFEEKFGIFSKKGALKSSPSDPYDVYWVRRNKSKKDPNDFHHGNLNVINASLNTFELTFKSGEKITMQYLNPENQDSVLNKVSKIKYIAHRGSTHIPKINPKAIYPANTEGAIEDALTQGFDGVEVDLHLSLNFDWIISHDNNLEVSTDCAGKIQERSSFDLKLCTVEKSSMIPESKFLRFKAKVPQPLLTLKELLNKYGSDSRLQNLILDVKPSVRGNEGKLLADVLKNQPSSVLSKITVLLRDHKDEETLSNELNQFIPIAVEDSKGYGLINIAEKKKNGKEQLIDSILQQGAGGALSLSVGLGLSFGSKEYPLSNIFSIIGNFFKLVPDLVSHSVVNFGKLSWNERRAQAMNKVVDLADSFSMDVIAWTVNSKIKLKSLNEMSPDISKILTDLPFHEVAKVKMIQMEKLTYNEDLTQYIEDSADDDQSDLEWYP